MSHSRHNSNFGATNTSLPPPAGSAASSSSAAGGAPRSQRYKAITRELLLGICRKHFVQKAVSASKSATQGGGSGSKHSRFDKEREEYMALETKLESLDHYLKRATHLQLDNLKLTHTFPVPELAVQNGQSANDHAFSTARSCRVLYLHDNLLGPCMDDFSFCAQALSHLYLQNNQIRTMAHLLPLQNLEKLYLGGNRIQKLEGFAREDTEGEQQQQQEEQQGGEEVDENGQLVPRANIPRGPMAPAPFYLIELHLDSQRLPPDVSFELSIPSVQALSASLAILTLSHNQMDSDSILPISLLSKLRELNLSHNRIADVKIVAEMCSYLPELVSLDLRENPLNSGANATAVTNKKYRDRVIMSSRSIATLDEKAVPDNQREYLHSLQAQKRLKRAQAAAAAGGAAGDKPKLTAEEEKFARLHQPVQFPYAPKVLTLRTTPSTLPSGVQSISINAMGGMGAGSRHTHSAAAHSHSNSGAGNSSTFNPRAGVSAGGGGGGYESGSSPFLDEDPNLDDGGSSSYAYPASNAAASSSSFASSQQLPPSQQQGPPDESEDPVPNGPFTGNVARLDYLLQTRGLVSAFSGQQISGGAGAAGAGAEEGGEEFPAAGQQPSEASLESARIRRATMNQLSHAQSGQKERQSESQRCEREGRA